MPRPFVRPSAASDPVPAERPGRGVPRWSSSGRGSRAPSRDGASWAGRSASSSGFCAILSIRPRDSTCDPKRHANAPGARERMARSSSRRMIGPAKEECQTCLDRVEGHANVAHGSRAHDRQLAAMCSPQSILLWSIARLCCGGAMAGAILSGPSAQETLVGDPHSLSEGTPDCASRTNRRGDVFALAPSCFPFRQRVIAGHQ